MKVVGYLFLLLSLSLWSCTDQIIDNGNNRISAEEQQLLDACSAALLVDSLSIAENLVGSWNLVGYGCGGCVPTTEVNVALTFTDTSGVAAYQDDVFGETIGFTWDIQRALYGTDTIFVLVTEPERAYTYMSFFCEGFMYRNGVANDGAMFLYQKQ